ncbi:MAG: hypothetical protein KDI87_02285 [Gammaproteobacteria bacterium]|nr:hypothetical protein [Gammaproteobacteria bacterium]MCP5140266.1 hypothetical protein [Chromatiales bacterium]
MTAIAVLAVLGQAAIAGPREQAWRMHERLTGVPPDATVLENMRADIAGGNATAAAQLAMDNSAFYNVTLKNFVAPWTNEEQSVFVPLNDYTATVIGMVRDDVPFNTLLSANLVYIGSGSGIPAYSPTNNDHYQALEDQNVDLKQRLTATTQTAVSGLPDSAAAGILTTRAAAAAFFEAGTNRAMFRFTMLNHLCRDMEQVLDTSGIPDRIRQDVSRSPGGDSRIFLNNCIGCHTGMDPMTQAFAYYNFDAAQGRLVYTPGQVQPKYYNNDTTFRYGYRTPNDDWANYWRHGQNRVLGWDPNRSGSGTGAKTMGEELANSTAFARCQVEKVFRNVCLRSPVDGTDRAQIDSMVTSFRAGGYRLKQVFAESATYCMGN